MHKLIVTLRKAARDEEATVETVDATSGDEELTTSGDEELVFLVGPRAAGFAVGRTSQVRSVLQKLSADR